MPCLRRPLQADRLRGGLFPLREPLRPDRRLSRFWTLLRNLTGRPLTGKLLTGPPLQGPLQADRLTGRPFTGRLLTGRPLTGRLLTGNTFNYRKADGKLRGGTLPELGGKFRLCAVDQKRRFFLTVGPGPLRADRPLREGPLQGGLLREGP